MSWRMSDSQKQQCNRRECYAEISYTGQIETYRKQYPPGTRVCVDRMPDDPNPLAPGTTGTVKYVDDMGTLHCIFDNGRGLGVVIGVDEFHVVQNQWEQLKKKIEQCYKVYYAEWMQKTPAELVENAEQIFYLTLTKDYLPETIFEEEAKYLLRFKDPLILVSDYWQAANLEDWHTLKENLENAVYHIIDLGVEDEEYALEDEEQNITM